MCMVSAMASAEGNSDIVILLPVADDAVIVAIIANPSDPNAKGHSAVRIPFGLGPAGDGRLLPPLQDVRAESCVTPEKYIVGAEIPTFYQLRSNLVADEDLKSGMVRVPEVDKHLALQRKQLPSFLK